MSAKIAQLSLMALMALLVVGAVARPYNYHVPSTQGANHAPNPLCKPAGKKGCKVSTGVRGDECCEGSWCDTYSFGSPNYLLGASGLCKACKKCAVGEEVSGYCWDINDTTCNPCPNKENAVSYKQPGVTCVVETCKQGFYYTLALGCIEIPNPFPPFPIASTPISVGSTFPFVSQVFDTSAGTTDPILGYATLQCQDYSLGFSGPYRFIFDFRKSIFKLNGLPTTGTLSVDDCVQPSQLDTYSYVFACVANTSNCRCYADDDGCGTIGGPDKVTGIPLLPNTDYYAVIMPFVPEGSVGLVNNITTGGFSITVNVT